MRLTVAYSVLLAHLATAAFYNGGTTGTGLFYEGAYGQGAPDSSLDIGPFQNGAANPNASSSVYFNGFRWRTNVSEVAATDATTIYGHAIPDAHVISAVFDLTWPGNGTIADALQSQRVMPPFGCIVMIDGLGLPANVTSKYTAADNGTCNNVLGEDCVRDFLATITPLKFGCPRIPYKPLLPPSCAGTLGTIPFNINGLAEDLEQIQAPAGTTTSAQNGQGFAHIVSSAYTGANATAALQIAESRLQILAIKGLNVMVCQKVNSTLTVTSTPSPAAMVPVSTTTNAASVNRMSYGALGLGMLGAVLIGL